MAEEESAAVWIADLSPEELAAVREWAEPRFDIHREYEDETTLRSEAEMGDFTVLIVKSNNSLGPALLKQLGEWGVRLQVWPGAVTKAKGQKR